MTQRNRPAVSVDITQKENVVASSAGKISSTTWQAHKGADEMRQLAEQIARAEHQREMDLQNSDPTIQRIIALENQMRMLTEKVGKLLVKAGELQ